MKYITRQVYKIQVPRDIQDKQLIIIKTNINNKRNLADPGTIQNQSFFIVYNHDIIFCKKTSIK